jgi:hypothetical protein
MSSGLTLKPGTVNMDVSITTQQPRFSLILPTGHMNLKVENEKCGN